MGFELVYLLDMSLARSEVNVGYWSFMVRAFGEFNRKFLSPMPECSESLFKTCYYGLVKSFGMTIGIGIR